MTNHYQRYIAILGGTLSLSLMLAPIFGAFHGRNVEAATPTGVMVPLYTYPTDNTWNQMIYAKSLGYTYTVGNPGTDTLPSYIGTVDNLIIHEEAGVPSLSYLGGWHSSYSKNNFSIIPYAVGGVDKTYVAGASSHVEYVYLT